MIEFTLNGSPARTAGDPATLLIAVLRVAPGFNDLAHQVPYVDLHWLVDSRTRVRSV